MSDAKDVKFSLKVVINKQKSKVLFAEADSDFADVLLSFLTLPLGTIFRVMNKHYGEEAPVIGSLTTLYNGLSNLDSVYFWTESGKQMLLNPRSSSETECRKLKLNVDDTEPPKYFKCGDENCDFKKFPIVSIYYNTLKCDCGKSTLSKEIDLRDSKTQVADDGDGDGDGDGGVFTVSTASFIITDDLQIMPSVTGNAIRVLRNLGITDTNGTELRNVTFGLNEVMDLLKGSLLSQTPLTDFILNKRQVDSVTAKCEKGTLLGVQIEKEETSNTKMITVKAILQNSTNKLLFLEAEEDFVDFLFSLLTVPLGGVECLFGGNTSLKNINNLYKSLENINGDKFLKTKDTKTMLLKPKLPFGYISKNRILPLNEESAPVLYYCPYLAGGCLSPCVLNGWTCVSVSCIKSPEGTGTYVKGPTMFMVTDDLTVTPLCSASGLSILTRLNIPLSDVRELDLTVGLEEALSILKASLTSTCALNDALINSLLKKQPKQER